MTDHSKSDVSELVRVKPLEWEKSEISGWNGDYHTVPSGYTVRCADEWGRKMLCLGKTKNGSPRHPLYVKGDTPLEPLIRKGGA